MSDKPKTTRTQTTRSAHVVFRRHPDHPDAFLDVVVFGDGLKALDALNGERRGYEYAEVEFGQPLTTALSDGAQ